MPLESHKLLDNFRITKKTRTGSIEAAPKLEYIRTKILRHFKKAIRTVLEGKTPEAGLHKYQSWSLAWGLKWKSFFCLVQAHGAHLHEVSSLAKGPYIDNRICTQFKTYTNKYVDLFLHDSITYETYLAYVDLLESDEAVSTYCRTFGMRCCDGEHSEKCEDAWKLFFYFLKEKMNSRNSYQRPGSLSAINRQTS